MKIATAAYAPEWHPDWDSLVAKLTGWVENAVHQGADLLVFPEYAGIEAGLIETAQDPASDLHQWVQRVTDLQGSWIEIHSTLAQRHGVYILAGSLPWHDGNATYNAAVLCAPGGQTHATYKMILTPYERNELKLTPGVEMQLCDTALGKIGVLICYDSEFPLLARALVEAGADMILVPSCTDFPAGQTRVRQSCRARAIEGQCLVVQSPLVGRVEGCDIVDQNTGRAALFCPPDHGLPANGIIAQGETDIAGWVIADVDPKAMAAPRQNGQVGNFSHWIEQDNRIKTVTSVALR